MRRAPGLPTGAPECDATGAAPFKELPTLPQTVEPFSRMTPANAPSCLVLYNGSIDARPVAGCHAVCQPGQGDADLADARHPSFDDFSGSMRGQGAIDQLMPLLTAQMPEYDHVLMRVNRARALQMLSDDTSLSCDPTMLWTAERARTLLFPYRSAPSSAAV